MAKCFTMPRKDRNPDSEVVVRNRRLSPDRTIPYSSLLHLDSGILRVMRSCSLIRVLGREETGMTWFGLVGRECQAVARFG